MAQLLNLIVCSFFLAMNISYAQTAKLKTGPKLEGAELVKKGKIISSELNLITCNSYENSMQCWHIGSENLSPVGNAKSISSKGKTASGLITNDEEFIFLDMLELENKSVIFYSKYDKNLKVKNLYYKEIDAAFEPASKEIALESSTFKENKEGLKLFSWTFKDVIWFKTNKQKNKVLIILQKEDKYINETWLPGDVSICVYEANDMKEINSGTANLGIFNYGASILFADNGYLYSIVEVQPATDKERDALTNKGEAFWYYKVIGLNILSADSKPFEYDLQFKNKGIIRVKIDYTASGLICVGTYSELTRKGKIDDFDGMFYAKLDPSTGAVIADTHKKLDKSIVEFLTGKSNSEKLEGISSEFKINAIVSMDNGTTNLIMEEQFVGSRGSVQFGADKIYYTAILVTNFDQNGEINWTKIIPKMQVTKDDEGNYSSFTYCKFKNGLKFLFTDNSDNYDPQTKKFNSNKIKKLDDLKSSSDNKSIAAAEIDDNGNIDQKIIATLGDYNLRYKNAVWSKSGNEVYFVSHPKNKFYHIFISSLTFN
jgi:hypothetical protein